MSMSSRRCDDVTELTQKFSARANDLRDARRTVFAIEHGESSSKGFGLCRSFLFFELSRTFSKNFIGSEYD